MIPLVFAEQDESYIVKKTDVDPETKKRLKDLGIAVGAEITVVSATGGDFIVNAKDSRVAVTRETARRIYI